MLKTRETHKVRRSSCGWWEVVRMSDNAVVDECKGEGAARIICEDFNTDRDTSYLTNTEESR